MTYYIFLFNILNIMAKSSVVLNPHVIKSLKVVGQQIKLARLRRKLSVQIVSERAGISTLFITSSGAFFSSSSIARAGASFLSPFLTASKRVLSVF